MINTKHSNTMEEVMIKRGMKLKPNIVIDYNRGKGYIDLCDQMGSYLFEKRCECYGYNLHHIIIKCY